MSRIRPGYEKYYINAECNGCGRETDTQYAYRFGEHEPTVYCDVCKRLRDKKRNHERKHPRNIGLVRTYCCKCHTYIGKYESWDGRPVLNEMCTSCIILKEEEIKDEVQPLKELNMIVNPSPEVKLLEIKDVIQPLKELNMIVNQEIKDMIQHIKELNMIPSPEAKLPEVLDLVDPLKYMIQPVKELKVMPDPGPEVRIEDYRNYFH